MDKKLQGFLEEQYEKAMGLARASDILELRADQGAPPRRYIATFHCANLVLGPGGQVQEHSIAAVGFNFMDEYLRNADVARMAVTWVFPHNPFHPNIKFPFICLGKVRPGTPITELIYRVFDVITWNEFQPDEHDALNGEACAWARQNLGRFPLERRPLKRRQVKLIVEDAEPESEARAGTPAALNMEAQS